MVLPDLTPEKLAYIAGIIDGEGSLSISKFRRVKAGKESYVVALQISNKSLDLLQTIHNWIGLGSIYKTKEKYYGYVLSPGSIRLVLPKILPYLILKKSQAIVCLQACDLLKNKIGNKIQDLKYIEDTKQLEILRQKNRELNGTWINDRPRSREYWAEKSP